MCVQNFKGCLAEQTKINAILYVCMYVCMHVCMRVCVCMHACMHACMYVCMYCMYACICSWKKLKNKRNFLSNQN